MRVDTISTFPDMFEGIMGASIMGRAQAKGLLEFHAHDLRDWTHDRHRTTDDEPFGGGHGLIMKCEPIFEAVEAVSAMAEARPEIIFLAPTGKRFDDAEAADLAQLERLLFVCGHYEGIDERAYTLADRIYSIGDYILTGGELASMVIIDAAVRKIPGVLGAEEGPTDESFADGLLEYPQYTRPASFRGMDVPPVLLSGNHAEIAKWRAAERIRRTAELRPDLLRSSEI